MLATKRGSKIQKKNAVFFSGVSPCLFNLADKARLHEAILPHYCTKVNLSNLPTLHNNLIYHVL
jgi:hypothetical protein